MTSEHCQVERQHLGIHRGSARRIDSKSEDGPEMDEEYNVEDQYSHHDYRVNADIYFIVLDPMGIEEFLDWQRVIDRFFEVMEVSESKQVKIVEIWLKSIVDIWWDRLVAQRGRSTKGQFKLEDI